MSLLAVTTAPGALGDAIHTPKAGSAERTAILNALRGPVQSQFQAPVTFYKVDMKVQNGWAWVETVAMNKAGTKLLAGPYKTEGLLHKVGKSWTVGWWGVTNGSEVSNASKNMFPQAPKKIFF